MKQIFSIACVITLVALAFLVSSVLGQHIAQGDFDKDGDVDFADFLVFSNNFGKSITEQTLMPLDTIVVRDTIIVNNVLDVEAGKRAGRMLGFWYLNYEYHWNVPNGKEIYEFDRVFFFTSIDDTTNKDGEYVVRGRHLYTDNLEYAGSMKKVSVVYSPSEQQYILTAENGIYIPMGLTTGLYDLECKFHFESEIHPDMTDRLNTYIDRYSRELPEPTVKIESLVAIEEREGRTSGSYVTTVRRVVMPHIFIPVNDGLRRSNRQEFMEKLSTPRKRTVNN